MRNALNCNPFAFVTHNNPLFHWIILFLGTINLDFFLYSYLRREGICNKFKGLTNVIGIIMQDAYFGRDMECTGLADFGRGITSGRQRDRERRVKGGRDRQIQIDKEERERE